MVVAIWIDHRQVAGVIHQIAKRRIFRWRFGESGVQASGERLNRADIASDAHEPLRKSRHVLRQRLGRVARWINADHHHLKRLALRFRQQPFRLAQHGHGDRADVWAVGVAEENQRPTISQALWGEIAAFGIVERECRDRARLRIGRKAKCPQFFVRVFMFGRQQDDDGTNHQRADDTQQRDRDLHCGTTSASGCAA